MKAFVKENLKGYTYVCMVYIVWMPYMVWILFLTCIQIK